MDNATSLITQFDLTKTQLKNFIAKVTSEVLDAGTYNPLQIIANLKAMEDAVSQIKKNLMPYALQEAAKYDKTFFSNGIEYTRTSRRTFDYSNNPRHTAIKDDLKTLETMLKNLSGPVADPETGEMLFPPTYQTTETISITLPE